MIDFRKTDISQRELITELTFEDPALGADRNFANMFMWGINSAVVDGMVVGGINIEGKIRYSFPMGYGDRKACIEKLISDAAERGNSLEM